MSVLGRYIVRTVLAYTALVTLVLAALGALFIFISQQGDIGTGNYNTRQALIYVALNMPSYLSQLLPVAALIGALLGLGNLARDSEIVVMRASGVTTVQFCGWLLFAGALLAVVVLLAGELAGPPLGQYARQMKAFSKFSSFSFAGNNGAWVRDGDTIISVQQQSATSSFNGVQVFRVVPGQKLLSAGRAQGASVDRKHLWRLHGYAATTFRDEGARGEQGVTKEVHSAVSPEFLGLAIADTDVMGIRDLAAYVDHLERNSLDATHFRIAFWSRVARLAAILIVVVLALPFVTGPMRSSGQGARTVIGILFGASFVLLSQMLENGGQLLDLPPWLIGWLPTAMLAALTSGMLWRAR